MYKCINVTLKKKHVVCVPECIKIRSAGLYYCVAVPISLAARRNGIRRHFVIILSI